MIGNAKKGKRDDRIIIQHLPFPQTRHCSQTLVQYDSWAKLTRTTLACFASCQVTVTCARKDAFYAIHLTVGDNSWDGRGRNDGRLLQALLKDNVIFCVATIILLA